MEIGEARRTRLAVSLGRGRPAGTSNVRPCPTKELGEHFDIHGGGLDLKFPHHENEIAQTCGATGGRFAEIWMHNGFLNIDNEKMSKSLGNFFTTREVLAKIKHPEVLRFFLLSSHYRGPMNYSPDQLDQAEAGLNRLYTALRDVPDGGDTAFARAATRPSTRRWTTTSTRPRRSRCCRAWRASSTLRAQPARILHRANSGGRAAGAGGRTRLLRVPPNNGSAAGRRGGALTDADIDARIAARLAARKAKNWAESDRIRDELAAAGVILEDKPGGVTTWRGPRPRGQIVQLRPGPLGYDSRPRPPGPSAGNHRMGGIGDGAWRSLVAHLLWEQRVAGSNPAAPTIR